MANVNTAWMPTKGKHRVEIGSSLARCLKSRKKNNGEATTTAKRSHLPDKDFYSFRYNHKPSSLDSKKQGMIQFEQGGAAPVILEHPSVQSGESTMYRGREAELRAYDCVLIIDEDTGTFTLEKLDACIQLASDRGLSSIMPRTDSPTPSNSTPRGSSNDPTRDPIDQDILDLVDDDLPSTSTQRSRKAPPPRKEEEEEEDDDDDFPAPARPPSQPKQQPVAAMPVPSASSRPSKPIPKARPKASPPQAPVSRSEVPPPRKSPPKQQPKYDQDDDIEELDVPLSKVAPAPSKPKLPAKPVQLPAKPAPAKPQALTKSTGLALPIKSSVPRPGSKKQSAAPTPAPPSQPVTPAPLALPGSSTAQPIRLPSSLPKPAPAPAAPIHEILEDSDEEDNDDNWVEVTTAAEPGAPPETSLSMQVDQEMEDISGGEDEDDFGQQLELEMELADGLGDALEEEYDEDDDMEPVPLPDGDGPISLNALAGGGAFNPGGLSDDDYSSSDDSDDD